MKRVHMKIVVIDLQSYWRDYSAETLRSAGHQIRTLQSYQEALQLSRERTSWDLILLGCAHVTQEEQRLVAHLIAQQQAVIVLATALSLQDLRSLFLQGARDVADKTYDPAELLTIVAQAQEQLAQRENSWLLARKGALV